ncbi:hypothetical protein MLD38_002832 [Melastoma candidum]|uniref:Uncharacterized protein n=1 Tax=Melastoma candidum TaxID=119954 RepID=A0ACB9S2L4_9MYRT|nr:hypothetical protein MLD38_002832 [Melastoma candidum]
MGPASLTPAFFRLLYLLPTRSSPFRRAVGGGALLCVAKSKSVTPSCSQEMVKAIRVHELGGAEVLKWEDVEVGEPKEGEIRVRHKAIGINFIDVYFRKGLYKAPFLPFIPAMEAVGEVVAVGPGLTGSKVGDIVAYVGHPMGSYAEE